MSHVTRDKDKLVARIRRLRGQMEAVERALLAEKPCGEVLRLLASIRGALTGLTGELVETHLREHVLEADDAPSRAEAVGEVIGILRSYLR